MPAAQSVAVPQVQYDDSRWPILLVSMPQRVLTDQELDGVMEHLSEYSNRGVAFGIVMDVRNCPMLPANQRRQIAERIDRDTVRNPKAQCSTALVLSGSAQKAVFSVMLWLTTQPAPLHACTTVEEGIAWVRDWLRRLVV
jgi:hypothetical protein